MCLFNVRMSARSSAVSMVSVNYDDFEIEAPVVNEIDHEMKSAPKESVSKF